MKVYFATNRKVNDNGFAEEISGLHVGEATVTISEGNRQRGERVNDWPQYQRAEFARDNGNLLIDGDAIEHLYERLTDDIRSKQKKTSVLLYIHGFRNSFEDSINRGARLAHIYSSDDHHFVPFVLSWPSFFEASPEGFTSGRANAELSGKAGAMVYDHMVRFATVNFTRKPDISEPCAEMFLIAHSMGVYMLRHMVQNVQERGTSLFNTAILAAANEDRDALGSDDKLRPFSNLTRQVVVYSYLDDSTLNLGYFSGAYSFRDCLGLHGPSPEAFGKYPGELSAIKCRDVIPSTYHSKHGYYHRLPNAVYDIRQVLGGIPSEEIKYRRLVKSGIWNQGEQVYKLKRP